MVMRPSPVVIQLSGTLVEVAKVCDYRSTRNGCAVSLSLPVLFKADRFSTSAASLRRCSQLQAQIGFL